MTTTETLITAYAAPAGTGERIWIVGDTLTFKATAETTGGTLTAIECEAAPGGGPPPHLHENEDESFYVLDGQFEILVGDELLRAGPGDYAFVPRGTVHRFANVGDAVGRLLILFTPGGLEQFFRLGRGAGQRRRPRAASGCGRDCPHRVRGRALRTSDRAMPAADPHVRESIRPLAQIAPGAGGDSRGSAWTSR